MATNTNREPKCVIVEWRLQDFEYESDLPTEFLIKGGQKLSIAKMRQTIWSFDDVSFAALSPSGKAAIKVRDADVNKKTGKADCLPDESFIQEPKPDGY